MLKEFCQALDSVTSRAKVHVRVGESLMEEYA